MCRTRPPEMPGTALLDALEPGMLEPGMDVRAVYLHPMTLGPLLDTWATGHPACRRSRTARAVVPLSAHRHQRPNSISPTPRSATPTFCGGSEGATYCPESIQSGMRVMIRAPTSTVKGPMSRARSRVADEDTPQPTDDPPSEAGSPQPDSVTSPLRPVGHHPAVVIVRRRGASRRRQSARTRRPRSIRSLAPPPPSRSGRLLGPGPDLRA